MILEKVIDTDVLVIGGGMAGNFAAIKAREQGCNVTITDKADVGKSGATHFAEGVIGVYSPEWGHTLAQLNAWMDQISIKSEYLNNRKWSEILAKDSYARYKDLVSWGVEVSVPKKTDMNFLSAFLNWQPSMASFHHRQYAPALRKRALEVGVRVVDRIMVSELLKQDGKVVGAIGFHTTSGKLYIFKAKATVIAMGGGGTFKETSQPAHYMTADGHAIAYRAGAEITGKEFIFSNWISTLRSDLKQRQENIKGAVIEKEDDVVARFPAFRGDGFALKPWLHYVNAEGETAIYESWEAHCGHAPVYADLDDSSMAHFKQYYQFVGMDEADRVGFDPYKLKGSKVKIPGNIFVKDVFGGAGIWPINTKCASNLPGLYAAGDSCATMSAGGARYGGGGGGILNAAVMGSRAGLGAAEYASKLKEITIDKAELTRGKEIVCVPVERKGGFSPRWVTQVLQGIMVPYFIFKIKHGERLQAALTLVEFMNNHLVPKLQAKDAHEWRLAQETKNMALNAEMMLRASLFRTESRGTHFREDYPRRDDPTWLAWVKMKEEQGRMKVWKEQIPKDNWPDLSKSYEERYPYVLPGE